MKKVTRRQATQLIAGTAASLLVSQSINAGEKPEMLLRPIPSTGEKLPVIGLGTSRVFDVGSSAAERQPLEEVLAVLVKNGGTLVDSSPMYGKAEVVIGESAARLMLNDSLFLATKVWTTGRAEGIKSMEHSLDLLGRKKLDLIQVHNLVDLPTQLATLREWKKAGRVRYIGITHYTESSQEEVARVLEKEPVDFVQINYSLMEREAEKRVLPVAKDRGVAVIVNRPLGRGDLFSRVRGEELPDWAKEFDCTSWAQFFLKWIMGNPIVTGAIPATGNPRHMADDLLGGVGRLPNEQLRKRMVELIAGL